MGLQTTGTTAHTSAPGIPFKRKAEALDSTFAGEAFGVLLVSILAIVAVLFARRRLGMGALVQRKANLVSVLETRRLGPGATVSVVEYSGVHFLTAVGSNGISCLTTKGIGGDA